MTLQPRRPAPVSSHSYPEALAISTAPWQRWNDLRWSNFTTILVIFFAGAVVLRSWIITAWLPQGLIVTRAIHYGGIFAVTLYIIYRGVSRLDIPTLALIVAFSFGSLASEYQEESLIKWLALGATIAAVGPLMQSRTAVRIRAMAWKVVGLGFVMTALASLMWVIFPLPRVEYGLFSGISLHPKTMGLDAALSVCLVAAWMTRGNTRLTVPLVMVSFVMVVLSGSRSSAVIALISLIMVFSIRGVKHLLWVLVFISLSILMLFFGPINEFYESKTMQYYIEKGFTDTRSHLWEKRFSEISNFPLFGVGIGMAETVLTYNNPNEIESGYAFIDAKGRVNIEPGSSWLAVFSMTGIVGGTLFLVIFARALRRLAALRRQIDNRKFAELVAVGVCFSLHMVEGGFILSFGNPHCLYFWLWLGIVYDMPRLQKILREGQPLRPGRY